MPLNILHKVHPVTKGARISFVKSVYVRKLNASGSGWASTHG